MTCFINIVYLLASASVLEQCQSQFFAWSLCFLMIIVKFSIS